MIHLTQTLNDPSGIVTKLIFEDKTAIAEAVVYKYIDRGVICFSVQSGCKVGCCFCGTGKKFIRDFLPIEMLLQIREGLKIISGCSRIQFMSMSMGEPLHNMKKVAEVVRYLNSSREFPPHEFLLSTVGINDPEALAELIALFKYKNFGLQFSLHRGNDAERKKLLGNHPQLLTLESIKHIAGLFKSLTGRKAYFNYICTGNETFYEARRVRSIVKGHHLTCSVLCNTKELLCGNDMYAKRFIEMAKRSFFNSMDDTEFSTFNPAGQDTIGGGCGQLLYVQEKLKGL